MVWSMAIQSGLYLLILNVACTQGRSAPFDDIDALTTTVDAFLGGLVPSDTTSANLPKAMNLGLVAQERLLGPSRVSAHIAQNYAYGDSLRKRAPADVRPTPEPTGRSSTSTTVHIADEHDFALLLPDRGGELIGDAESDGVAFCTTGSSDPSCTRHLPDGFILAAAVSKSDSRAYIQVTGCLDISNSSLDPSDTGGQFDVRFPNGAQCTFGGYGASFIQLVEPAANRFCLRCCSAADDQVNCNSHQDREGCETAIPGTYTFPALGVSCEE